MSAPSTLQLDVAKNYIYWYVIKNNLRTLRGVIVLPCALHFGMFVHSATLILRFAHFVSKTGGFG